MSTPNSYRASSFAPRETLVEHCADGSLILRSPIPFEVPQWSILDFLPAWAEKAPDRIFLAQRGGDRAWQTITYAQMWQRVRAVAASLIDLGAKSGDNMVILSGASIEHAIVMFAAMSVSVVVAPISPNYSLMPGGLALLGNIAQLLQPAFVFAQDGAAFAGARGLSPLASATWIVAEQPANAVSLESLYERRAGTAVDQAWASVDKTVAAKILFTSGSTGLPKGVINTHRMMACSLEMGALLAPTDEAPVQVEWLPWHHTMGGNVILNGILKNGGSLYIDDGRPLPALFHKTITNLRDISPTAMFNVPSGYVLLCEALEADAALRANFFKRLTRMTYAGAAIAHATLDKLYELSARATDRKIPVMAGYGTTETAPSISTAHWATEQPGEVGLPAPGLELKLIPNGDDFEVRVRGPNVMPGYYGQPEVSAAAFDAQGFYRVGDTVAFLDPKQMNLGLRITGRLSENFKLSNGTWVVVGRLRAALVNAAQGALLDVVIAGENRDRCAILAWLNPVLAKAHATDAAVNIHRDPGVLAYLRHCLAQHNASSGSSEQIGSFMLLREPASLANGEITDKAYVNQRAVLRHRAALVDGLYAPALDASVISVQA